MERTCQETPYEQAPRRSARLERRRVSPSTKVKFISRSWHFSVPRDRHRPSILLLPPEIRNRIMQFVLVPGDIYLPGRPSSIITKARRNLRAKDPIEAVVRRIHFPYLSMVLDEHQARQDIELKYGCQVLATCKQLYCEGHAMFYSLNTFHLAPGPLCISANYFDNLQPHHSALIKHIAVGFGMADVTPILVSELRAKVSGKSISSSTPRRDVTAVTRHLREASMKTWSSKLMWLRSWQSLGDVKVQYLIPSQIPGQLDFETPQIIARELVIKHDQLRTSQSGELLHWDEQIKQLIIEALGGTASLLMLKVAISGWEGLADWLAALKLGPKGCMERKI